MARAKNGPWSKYRNAHALIAELEAQREKHLRTRPRTSGKKAAKTRALNVLARRISAAKGRLTKARKAIALKAATRSASRKVARQKRGEAAKRGWVKRRARTAPVPVTPSSNKEIPHLTRAGVVWVWPPSKDDRSKEGRFWVMVDRLLSNQHASFAEFEGDSIFDEISGKRLPFVTDLDIIYAYSDEFIFGLSFYRDRHEYTKVA